MQTGSRFLLTGGARSAGRTGAIFPILLNEQTLIHDLQSHRLSIAYFPFDSHAYSVQACGRNCIKFEEEKVGMVI